MQSVLLFYVRKKHGTDKRVIKPEIYAPVILGVFLLLLFVLISAGNANTRSADFISSPESAISSMDDQDGDGLSDELENTLGTENDSKYGDLDNDGLYDFEEVLDIYGSNNTDNPKYNYSDSTSYGDVLDIYYYFGLNSNKSNYLRDQSFTEENGGFTNYLLWNVSFDGDNAGGKITSAVTYNNNIIINVSFNSDYTGGSSLGVVNYSSNMMINVSFDGDYAGGVFSKAVNYRNNTMTNVSFAGTSAGGGKSGNVTYTNNTVSNILLSGVNASKSQSGTSSYTDNVILADSYDTDSDGLGDGHELFESGTNPRLNDTDGDGLNDKWEVRYNEISGVNPLVEAMTSDLASDATDNDGLNISEEAKANTDPTSIDTDGDGLNDSYEVLTLKINGTSPDTDGDGLNDSYEVLTLKTNASLVDSDSDGLNDKWELTYNGTSGVNPLVEAMASDLASDMDNDSLTLLEEAKANTNPILNDTDGDGLADKWEVTYNGTSGVNPLVEAMTSELAFDMDNDSLTLLEEARANTNPTLNDTDGDGLTDKWEVTYNGASGVNPFVNVTTSELASDMDTDGLNLSEEFKVNTNPAANDTDGDGLADKWEVTYDGASGVNPLDMATDTELSSDLDTDGLTLTEEFKANTNPSLNDTDGDGLADKWEATYTNISGVNPFVAANNGELTSDTDVDGLNLTEEFKANTNPSLYDTDRDNLNDSEEVFITRTDPLNPDTDGDKLDDGYEHTISGTDPLDNDTDNDGLSDGFEVITLRSNATLTDSDGDGLNDSYEYYDLGTDPALVDTDGDTLNDSYELSLRTDPLSNDSDSDGLTDGHELSLRTDPLSNDSDSDGLTDGHELSLRTDPLSNDSDSDGLTDGREVLTLGTNPLSSDSDGDGLDDMDEVTTSRTSPILKDTDFDGLNDYLEYFILYTDPLTNDSDRDGLKDRWEDEYREFHGVNPLIRASGQELASDYDSDGSSLLEESIAGTDPGNNDTDGDGLSDGWEIMYNELTEVDPLVPVPDEKLAEDADNDGLTLLEEERAGTNPASNDTDGDKLNDKWELIYQEYIGIDPLRKSSPLSISSDSDEDGLTLLNESIAGTDPASSDTDDDGLGDGWELTYIDTDGVDPVVKATEEELESDQDNDRLTLLEEAQRNKNPNKADNEELSVNGSSGDFAFLGLSYLQWILVIVSLLLIFFIVTIIYILRKRRAKGRTWDWSNL